MYEITQSDTDILRLSLPGNKLEEIKYFDRPKCPILKAGGRHSSGGWDWNSKERYDSNTMTNIFKYFALGLILAASSCINNESKMENNIYRYWIQRYDYSSQDYGIASVEKAIKAFHEYDWDLELSFQQEGSGDKDCPSGIGIHNGYGESKSAKSLLHICPLKQNSVFLNLHYPVEKKFLGLIPYTKEEIYYANDISKETVPEIIRLFYKKNFAEIIKITTN